MLSVDTKEKKLNRFTRKKTAVLLFALSAIFIIAAAAVYLSIWNEGEKAKSSARRLLELSGIKETENASGVLPADAYVQPEEPDAMRDEDIYFLLDTELYGYSVIARLDISSLDIHLPVLSKTSDKALKISICHYKGPSPGEKGNLVITGHNYRNGAHFGKLDKIKTGDTATVTDTEGGAYTYEVYNIEHIKPDDAAALDNTRYAGELSLLTCEARGNRRLLVRCRLLEE